MKTRNVLAILTLLLLTMAFAGCKDDSDELSTIRPINIVDTEILAFFENELPAMGTSNSFFTDVAKETEICFVVNDNKDLQHLYKGKSTLPIIDFSKYTLVIGKVRMKKSFFYVAKQVIEVKSNSSATINIYVAPVSEDGSWPLFSTLYFYGLYPKLSVKTITINKIIH